MKCNICSGELHFYTKIDKYNFDVYKCTRCGTLCRYPLPTEEEIKNYYTENYYSGKASYNYIDERKVKFPEVVWSKRIDILIDIYQSINVDFPKRILDVGCAFGGFLSEAQKKGLHTYGVEISDYSFEIAKKKGIEMLGKDIQNIDIPENFFDIITMIEIIEHLTNPKKTIEKLFKSLQKGGILLIQTANMDALQARIFGKNYHYFLPGHLHYFTDKSLRFLLKEVGFRGIVEFYPVEFGLMPKIIKVYFNTKGFMKFVKIIKTSLYHFISKFKMGNKRLTSSMVMIAVK